MNKEKTIREIVYGVAVGDALGFPYQFIDRYARKEYPVIDMGISQDSKGNLIEVDEDLLGLWSDDTSLTLCLAVSLAGGYNLVDMSERFIKWLDTGYLSAKNRSFDVGHQTYESIRDLKQILQEKDYSKLSQRMQHPFERANGNGALMRILPLITYIYHLDMAAQYKIVEEVSALTHHHVRSVICCFLYLKIAEKLIDGLGLSEAVQQSQKEVRDFLASPLFAGSWDKRDEEVLSKLLHNDLSQGLIDPDDEGKEAYIKSDGYVVSSLEAALWSLLNGTNYRDTILLAVNLGDDADSVAAIAGGLAALYYGEDSIPKAWISALKKPETITRIIQKSIVGIPFPRSYWVQDGMFLAGYTPASLVKKDMLKRLQALLDAGIRGFINLMEPDEKDYEGLLFENYEPHLQELAAQQGLEISYYNLPIKDRNITTRENMRQILDTINASLAKGTPIYIHCWGGKGRTGTVVGCWLQENRGLSGLEALAKIAELREDDPKRDDPSPETEEQLGFVINWEG